jgi:hypothetical protein
MNTRTGKTEENNNKYFEQVLSASQSLQSACERVLEHFLMLGNLQNYVERLQTIKVTTHPGVNHIEPTEGINGDPRNAS